VLDRLSVCDGGKVDSVRVAQCIFVSHSQRGCRCLVEGQLSMVRVRGSISLIMATVSLAATRSEMRATAFVLCSYFALAICWAAPGTLLPFIAGESLSRGTMHSTCAHLCTSPTHAQRSALHSAVVLSVISFQRPHALLLAWKFLHKATHVCSPRPLHDAHGVKFLFCTLHES
jgi:hypothetical protein